MLGNLQVGVCGADTGHADAGAVAEEDFSKALRHHGAHTAALDGLRGVLSRGTAAEVFATEYDSGSGVLRGVDRVAFAAAVGVESLVVEHGAGQFIEGHALEEARGDDAVGVHIGTGYGHGLAGDGDDFVEGHV